MLKVGAYAATAMVTLAACAAPMQQPSATARHVPSNEVYGTDVPPLLSSRAFAIHTKAAEDHPDRMAILNDTIKKVFSDPEYKQAVEGARGHWEYIDYGDAEACREFVASITAIGERFKDYLTGKS